MVEFVSRNGNRFAAPAWFVEGLPDTPLDGELFLGRSLFQKTVGVVKSSSQPERWRKLKSVHLVVAVPVLLGWWVG